MLVGTTHAFLNNAFLDLRHLLALKCQTQERATAFVALNGILAGHEVDLDNERAERILSR